MLVVELQNVQHLEASGGSSMRCGFKISLEMETNKRTKNLKLG
jgi:hypothetical protein